MTTIAELDAVTAAACLEHATTGDLDAPETYALVLVLDGRRLKDGPFPEALARRIASAVMLLSGVTSVHLRGPS